MQEKNVVLTSQDQHSYNLLTGLACETTNLYLDFFHYHQTRAPTHSISEAVCFHLQVKTCDLLIYLCLFFSQKNLPEYTLF